MAAQTLCRQLEDCLPILTQRKQSQNAATAKGLAYVAVARRRRRGHDDGRIRLGVGHRADHSRHRIRGVVCNVGVGMNAEYSTEERGLISRLFFQGLSDDQIAARLFKYSGRRAKGEAIRKQRRIIGLKKKPTYNRWEWQPDWATP
jgi:hypothetical protein